VYPVVYAPPSAPGKCRMSLTGVYTIDRDHCIYFQKGRCRACEKVCESHAIDFSQEDSHITVDAGAIIVSAGFEPTDPRLRPEFGYGRYPNVVTSIEFERLLSAAGPFEGQVRRPSDGERPIRIGWVQCVGSRDASIGKDYCSYACCMSAIKQAMVAKGHDPRIQPFIFFIDIRAQGKGFERYFERAKLEHGVRFVPSMVSRLTQDPVTSDLEVHYLDEEGVLRDEILDMVVLSVGFTPHPQWEALAGRLGLSLDRFGFCENEEFNPISTSRPGVFVCGVSQGPKDIPDSVVQASGAAAGVMAHLAEARDSLGFEAAPSDEKEIVDEEPRIGVFVCHCGNNIAGVVDVVAVKEYAMTLPNVVHAEDLLFTCSSDAQGRIQEVIRGQRLNRVVVASCSPRTHEPLFQDTIQKAGLNKYLMEMANIRDQCSWVHADDPEKATEKAKDLVRMSLARSALLEPIKELAVDVCQKGLVVGGGIAGMTAALNLADQGFETVLVEKEDELGGNATKLRLGPRGEDISKFLATTLKAVRSHPLIHILTRATIQETVGHVGKFKTRIRVEDREVCVDHGATIVAIGGREHQPREYFYGRNSRVMTQREFHARLVEGPDFPGPGKRVVMIQFVGSREEAHPYCSRICCTQAVTNALRVKKVHPRADVYVLFRDIRTFGLYELLYKEAREAGVRFIRYDGSLKPEVEEEGDRFRVRVRDLNLREELKLQADYLVLSVAIRPHESIRELAASLKLPVDPDGFFLESHIKLKPLDFANAGHFLCGLAHGPKFLDESVTQAMGAASRAATILSRKQMMVGAQVAVVDREKCITCMTCARTCPFGVPKVAGDGLIQIDPAECHGCGICASACPRKLIQVRHMRDDQIIAKEVAICG
jgi:heterodisulfide reductase subunit A-like polyferredoxin